MYTSSRPSHHASGYQTNQLVGTNRWRKTKDTKLVEDKQVEDKLKEVKLVEEKLTKDKVQTGKQISGEINGVRKTRWRTNLKKDHLVEDK